MVFVHCASVRAVGWPRAYRPSVVERLIYRSEQSGEEPFLTARDRGPRASNQSTAACRPKLGGRGDRSVEVTIDVVDDLVETPLEAQTAEERLPTLPTTHPPDHPGVISPVEVAGDIDQIVNQLTRANRVPDKRLQRRNQIPTICRDQAPLRWG